MIIINSSEFSMEKIIKQHRVSVYISCIVVDILSLIHDVLSYHCDRY